MMNYIALTCHQMHLLNVVTDGAERTPKIHETASLRSEFLQ